MQYLKAKSHEDSIGGWMCSVDYSVLCFPTSPCMCKLLHVGTVTVTWHMWRLMSLG